jgi:hypothetical protein
VKKEGIRREGTKGKKGKGTSEGGAVRGYG